MDATALTQYTIDGHVAVRAFVETERLRLVLWRHNYHIEMLFKNYEGGAQDSIFSGLEPISNTLSC